MKYEIYKTGNYLHFERDHGECYGGIHKTIVDISGKKAAEIYEHIADAAGTAFADAARNQGYC